MKVEMVIPTPSLPCGVFEYTNDLAASLKEKAVGVHICAGTVRQIADYLENAAGIDRLHLQFGYYLYPVDFLAYIIRLARRRGWPVVVTMHGFRRDYEAHHQLMQQTTLVVHSSRMAGELIRTGFSPARTHVLEMPCPPITATRKVHPSRVGHFGFLLPHKGLLQLIQAVAELSERYPAIEAVILSAQAPFEESLRYRRFVEDALKDPRLAGRVDWDCGFVSRETALRALAGCTVVALPYSEHSEIGVSAAARLALSSARPVVTTDASFFDGLETDAYRIASPSPEAIADAIGRLADDPSLLAEYARRAADHARRHSWTALAERLLKVYRTLESGSISSSAKSFLK